MTQIVVRRTVGPNAQRRTIKATYEGGPYIEVGPLAGPPKDVINVWDYETNTSRIETTREAVAAAFEEWITTYSGEDPVTAELNLVHDIDENWRHM